VRTRAWTWLLAAALLGGLVVATSLRRSPPDRSLGLSTLDQPNIVIFTLCSFRADGVGAYGNDDGLTPNLDALAQEGVVFERAYTNGSFTPSAHASLLTGLLPGHHHIMAIGNRIGRDVPTLPQVLGVYGYATGAIIGSGSDPAFGRIDGLADGFDQFQSANPLGQEIAADLVQWLESVEEPHFALVHIRSAHKPYLRDGVEPPLDPAVQRWLQADRVAVQGATGSGKSRVRAEDQRLLATIQSDPAVGESLRRAYDEGVRQADTDLGMSLAALRKLDSFEHTVVIVTSDHGEALGEAGHLGHQHNLDEGLVHVPLVVRLPGAAQAGRRIDADVSLVDILPTVLTLAGAVIPADVDGRSLVPLLQGHHLDPRPAISEMIGPDQRIYDVANQGELRIERVRGAEAWQAWRRTGAWSFEPAPDRDSQAIQEIATQAELRTKGAAVTAPTEEIAPAARKALQRQGYW